MFINVLPLIIEASKHQKQITFCGEKLFPKQKTLSDMSYTVYYFCKSL